MTVYVDDLVTWAHARVPFTRGSCHLTADSLGELHAFAVQLNLKRSWFQAHPRHPHYDLTPAKRQLALHLGAQYRSAKDQIRHDKQQSPP